MPEITISVSSLSLVLQDLWAQRHFKRSSSECWLYVLRPAAEVPDSIYVIKGEEKLFSIDLYHPEAKKNISVMPRSTPCGASTWRLWPLDDWLTLWIHIPRCLWNNHAVAGTIFANFSGCQWVVSDLPYRYSCSEIWGRGWPLSPFLVSQAKQGQVFLHYFRSPRVSLILCYLLVCELCLEITSIYL